MIFVSHSPAHDLPDYSQPASLPNASQQQHYTPITHVFCGSQLHALSHDVTCDSQFKVLPVVCQPVWCGLQAHETPVRSMQYAHNENWLLTGEDDGKLKYWKPNLECVKVLLSAWQ